MILERIYDKCAEVYRDNNRAYLFEGYKIEVNETIKVFVCTSVYNNFFINDKITQRSLYALNRENLFVSFHDNKIKSTKKLFVIMKFLYSQNIMKYVLR